MQEVIALQITAADNLLDNGQSGVCAVSHGNRHGAIEFNDWGRIGSQQNVIQSNNCDQSVSAAVLASA